MHALLGPEQADPVEVRADAVLLATGGYEKVLPFPGWTLPGVVTAGGAQAMLKGGLVTCPAAPPSSPGPARCCCPSRPASPRPASRSPRSSSPPTPRRSYGGPARWPPSPGKVAEGARYAAGLLRHRVARS